MAWSGAPRTSSWFNCCTGPRGQFVQPTPTPTPTPGLLMFEADTPWLLDDGGYLFSETGFDVMLTDLSDQVPALDSGILVMEDDGSLFRLTFGEVLTILGA